MGICTGEEEGEPDDGEFALLLLLLLLMLLVLLLLVVLVVLVVIAMLLSEPRLRGPAPGSYGDENMVALVMNRGILAVGRVK